MVSLLRFAVLIQLITETVYSAVVVVSNYILVLAKYSRNKKHFGQLITYFQILQTAFYYYVLALLKATSSRHSNSSRSGIEAKSVSLNKVKYILAKSCW